MKEKTLIGAIVIFTCAYKINFQTHDISIIQKRESLQNLRIRSSVMRVRDLVILVKYAQGAVVFNSFYSMLKFFKPLERKIFLSQVVELTKHFTINDSIADLAIKKSGLSETCTACLILKEGVSEIQLQKIVDLSETELESSLKLLLTLFSISYQEGYQKNKNDPDKFWYWDYSNAENSFKLIKLDDNQYLQLDQVLRP